MTIGTWPFRASAAEDVRYSGPLFKWAVDRDYVAPELVLLKQPVGAIRKRERCLTEQEVSLLLSVLRDFKSRSKPSVHAKAIRFMLLTAMGSARFAADRLHVHGLLGISSEITEGASLNHADIRTSLGSRYNKSGYTPQLRQALQKLANWYDKIESGEQRNPDSANGTTPPNRSESGEDQIPLKTA